ncbi:MAG TPA: S41 family peptidase, partial [Bryobacteraceae bacterium]|nr:S41 family peptidase [Bryobacteraceae bacterium]
HDEYRPKMDQADSMETARQVMRDMIGRLKQTHFAIIPMSVYEESGAGDDPELKGEGEPGLDLRVLENHAIVTRLDPGSPAEAAGIKPGWQITKVDGKDLDPVIKKLKSAPDLPELLLERAVMSKLTGRIGNKVKVTLRDGANKERTIELTLAPPRGQAAKFGNLPAEHVWVESKKIGNTGYIAFNMFLDLPRVMGRFADEVGSCLDCDGLIIDLRGNPGGIGGMAMGMAGFLIDTPNQKLGDMLMRDATLHFVVNPRTPHFKGPVAVLVDGSSASTSEILAEGLKDLGRAKIFGERTAAAALPSYIEKLPNGDGFQYAVANYISEGGKPLEGIGVTPDITVRLTREALLAGHDAVLDAAMEWIRKQSLEKQGTQK